MHKISLLFGCTFLVSSVFAQDSYLSLNIELKEIDQAPPVSAMDYSVQSGTRSADIELDGSAHRRQGKLPARRPRQPTVVDLVVVSYSDTGVEVGRLVVPNPSVVRGEFLGAPGSGEQAEGGVTRFRKDSAQLFLDVPEVPGVARIEILQPYWRDTEFFFRVLKVISVN